MRISNKYYYCKLSLPKTIIKIKYVKFYMCSHTKNTPHILLRGCIFMFLDNLAGTELVTLANILAI